MDLPSMTPATPPNPAERPLDRDLGFGSLASRQHYRLLNRDGSFNVRRMQQGWIRHFFAYHRLISLSWRQFFALVAAAYLAINAVFALLYVALGPAALQGSNLRPLFLRAFFFSVDTFSTVGYGNIVPVSLAANVLVTLEMFAGLLFLAVATGLVFARFSRPNAKLLYSRAALIAPYQDVTSFQFRVVNGRSSQLVNVQAKVVHSRFENEGSTRVRRFYTLSLERTSVAVFPANWTVVHPITPESPIFGWTREQLLGHEAEFLVLLSAVDETYSQTVYSRSSYTADEIEWGRKFAIMFFEHGSQAVVDLERLNETVAAPLPRAA
jgi:inward rectifier potassium channel